MARKKYARRSGLGMTDTHPPRPSRPQVNPDGHAQGWVDDGRAMEQGHTAVGGVLSYPPDLSKVPNEMRD